MDACGIPRASSTVETLKAPSSRALLGGRCGGRPSTALRLGRRSSGPSGLVSRRSSRAVVVHSNHVQIASFLWSSLVATPASVTSGAAMLRATRRVFDVRAGSVTRAPLTRRLNGDSPSAHAPFLTVVSGHLTSRGGGRQVIRHERRCVALRSIEDRTGFVT